MNIESHVQLLIQRYPPLAPISNDIQQACETLVQSLTQGGKILLCGNGGSASDCDHIVGELVKAFRINRPVSDSLRVKLAQVGGQSGEMLADQLQGALPALNLTAQSALVTALMNDVGADMVFSQQVLAYGQAGDCLIAISTSGNSANVVNALITARARGLHTIGLTGETGGKMNAFCDTLICVPAKTTADIQEFHLPIYHSLCSALEDVFFEPN